MAGIFGVFLNKKKINSFLENMTDNPVKDEYNFSAGIVGRSTIDKLQKDRFFETKNGITICFEGVNLSDSLQTPDSFFTAYHKEGINFTKSLKGNYSGFVLDEHAQKVCLFNDHLSTKNIFYYYKKDVGFVFASELQAAAKMLKKEGITYSINRDAIYMMALYGFLLEDTTYLCEVKKMPYSTVITYDISANKLDFKKLHSYSNNKIQISREDATNQINELVEQSISRNWNKDLEYGNKHLSLLSGGMDAKTNILIAKKLGFDNISTITFGQSDSTDIKYAQKIAIKEKFNHFQRIIDYPRYLIDDIFENYVQNNDGLMMYHSSAHASSTVKSFGFKVHTLHTGQLGDSIFGSFTKPGFDFEKSRDKIGYTGFISDPKILDKIESLPGLLKKYQSLGYDMYNIEQRQINATLIGDRSLNNTIDNTSPFSDVELIKLSLSLPDEFKKNQMIYYHWLKKYHPEVLNYPWEKIQMRPNSAFKMKYGRLYKKYFNGAKKYFNLKYDSMNPYGHWLKKYPEILNTLNEIFCREIENEKIDKELKKDLSYIYNNDIFEYRNKFAVVTALLAIKLHFGNES